MTTIFPDRNISPAHFANQTPGTLAVTTIFYTFQGEGPFAGHPATFVRLAGCNLGAKGVGAAGCEFCDTDFRIDNARQMTFGEIATAMNDALVEKIGGADADVRHMDFLAVVTGGEPLLQKNLQAFCLELMETGYTVQVETNGMYYQALPGVTVVVSPKLGSLTHYPQLRPNVLATASCLKFVLSADPLSPYHTVPEYAFEYLRTRGHESKDVFVSPMAVYLRAMTKEEGERASIWDRTLIDHEATAANYRYAAEYAVAYGLRLSFQTHLFAAMP